MTSAQSTHDFEASLLSLRSTASKRTDAAPDQLDATNANDDAGDQDDEHCLVGNEIKRALTIPYDNSVSFLARGL